MAVSKILSVALFVSVYLVLVSGFGYGGIPGGIRRKYGGVIGGGFGAGKLWCTCRRYGCNIDEWRYSTTCSLPIFPWQWDTCCKWFPWWLTINYGSSFGRFGGGSGFGLSGGFSGGVGSGGSGRVGPVGSVGFGGLGGGGPIGGVGVGGVGGVGPVGGVGVGGAGGVGPVGGVGIGGAGGLRGYGKGAY